MKGGSPFDSRRDTPYAQGERMSIVNLRHHPVGRLTCTVTPALLSSLRFHARCLDDLAPALGFLSDLCPELFWRQRLGIDSAGD